MVAAWSHNPSVTSLNLVPATNFTLATQGVGYNPGPNWPIPCEELSHKAIAIPFLLIKTQPRKEQVVTSRLLNAFGENVGFEAYLPLITSRRAGGRGEYCPLFPGYVFSRVPVGLISDANSIMSCGGSQAGIGSVVRFGGWPATVSQAIIDELQKRQGISGFIDLEAENEQMEREIISNLQHGDQVATNSGPFSGIKAIFQCHRGGDRVVLLYQMLGGQRSVELPARQVVKV